MLALIVGLGLGACQQAGDDDPSTQGNVNGNPMAPAMTGVPTGQPPAAPGAPGAVGTPPPTGTPPAGTPPATTPPPAQNDPDNPSATAGAGSEPPPADMGAAGSAADMPAEMAGSGEEMPPPHMDLGKGDGSDVITIGDSWMTLYSGGIEGALDRAGTSYRHYGIAGTTLIGGDIPQQYERAKAANKDIKTVIMTGGGNDIMFTGGCNTKEACEMSVAAINDALNTLWTEMAADGVKDVIYVQYSKDAGTTPQDTRPTTPPPPPAICLTGMIGCHSLATTDLVMGELVDGIHPSGAAHDRIAAALLDMMAMGGMRR
jgi:lysophospholipase L1-like esterase